MKKILRKIGITILLIAMIIPVIDLPIVNADSNNCENHLQNYLFLDKFMFNPGEEGTKWVEQYSSNSDGRTTSTYFLYSFPENTETQTVKIKSVEQYNFDDVELENDIKKYWQYFNATVKTINGGRKYWEAAEKGDIFVESSVSKKYKDQAILLHGVWGNEFDSKGNYELAYWDEIEDGEKYTIQNVLTDEDRNEIESTILMSEENSSGKIVASDDLIDVDYFTDLITNKTNVVTDSEEVSIFPISISRIINVENSDAKVSEVLNNYIFGHTDTENNTQVIYADAGSTAGKINDSFSGLEKGTYITWENMTKEDGTAMTKEEFADYYEQNVDFEVAKDYYWPVVLTVEYETCQIAAEEVEKWNLEYDDNVEDNSVKNVPDASSADVGEGLKVDTSKPERDGYKFVNWCEDPKGETTCYVGGGNVISNEPVTLTLYAQWAKEGTTDNNKTGVVSYIIGFMSIGLIAGGAYHIARKKNLFKQV